MKFEFELPVKAETLNVRLRKHPMQQHREKTAEIRAVATMLPKHQLRPLLVVTLVRRGPKPLDIGDNLPGSLKAFRDAVARAMKLDDASPLIEWRYDQEPGEYSVLVRIQALGELPPDTRPPPKPWQLPPVLTPRDAPRTKPSPRGGRSAPKDLRALATPATYRPGRKP